MIGHGVLCFGYASTMSTWLLVPFLILFGIGYRDNNPLGPSLRRKYFGRTNFRIIFGLIVGMGAIEGIIGPTLAGWTYDNWSSYQVVQSLLASLATVVLISDLTIARVRNTIEPGDKS